jgi:hypothetical protein
VASGRRQEDGSARVVGVINQSDLFHVMAQALGLE